MALKASTDAGCSLDTESQQVLKGCLEAPNNEVVRGITAEGLSELMSPYITGYCYDQWGRPPELEGVIGPSGLAEFLALKILDYLESEGFVGGVEPLSEARKGFKGK